MYVLFIYPSFRAKDINSKPFLELLGDRFSYSYFFSIDGRKNGLELLNGQVWAILLFLLQKNALENLYRISMQEALSTEKYKRYINILLLTLLLTYKTLTGI